jgi:ribonucleoside-diphosphate reductase beta chain
MTHATFASTARGLRRDIPPMRLFEKAKRLGVWNPSDIDFSRDALDWQRLSEPERDLILRLTALFQAGEEAVTLDILPLLTTIAREGRIEEELFLTTFLWEEAKHTDFFRRFLDDVAGVSSDLSHYHTPNYRALIYEALPTAMQRLYDDPSPAAQAEASLTYNLIVEGVLAETGYHAYFTMLERNDLLPGVRRGIRLLKQDESRHIAYGVFLLSRLIAEHDDLWDLIEQRMNDLVVYAIGVIDDAFACYDEMPFGLAPNDFMDYALGQFQRRLDRVERARGQSIEEIYRVTQAAIDAGEA